MSHPADPDVHPAAARGTQILAALCTLNYPQATEEAPGWQVQLANSCTCDNHPRAAETAFAIFWVILRALESVDQKVWRAACLVREVGGEHVPVECRCPLIETNHAHR